VPDPPLQSPGAGPVSALISDTLPLVAVYVFLDALGPSWAHQLLFAAATLRFGAVHNVFSFWGVALPLGGVLAFQYGWGVQGLWAGLVVGMALLVSGLGGFILCAFDWDVAARAAVARSSASALGAGTGGGRLAGPAAEVAGGVAPGAPPSRKADSGGTALPLLSAMDPAFDEGAEQV
jgi:MATE family multidrug resistance protein